MGEFKRFRTRLWTLAEAEFGASPSISGDTIRMPTGALVVLREFSFGVLPRLGEAISSGEMPLVEYVAQLQGRGWTSNWRQLTPAEFGT